MRKFFLTLRRCLKDSITSFRSSLLPDKFYSSEFLSQEISKNIGKYTYGNIKIMNAGEGGELKVGNFCSIAGGVTVLLGGNHQTEWITTYPFPATPDFSERSRKVKDYSTSKGDVIIGNDVQLGQDALILSGITIGDGAVVGAGSVVTKDIPPYGIVAGNPAKIIRLRFPNKIVSKLLKIKWWNWTDLKIKQNVEILCSQNISALERIK